MVCGLLEILQRRRCRKTLKRNIFQAQIFDICLIMFEGECDKRRQLNTTQLTSKSNVCTFFFFFAFADFSRKLSCDIKTFKSIKEKVQRMIRIQRLCRKKFK